MKKILLLLYFIYRHTIRSNNIRLKAVFNIIKNGIQIYILNQ